MRVWQAALAGLAAAVMTAAVEARAGPDAGVRAHSFEVLLRRLDQNVSPEIAPAMPARPEANRAL